MKLRTLLFSGTFAALLASPALGQSMVGEAHDFSGTGWAGGEICKPCHTPHNAVVDESGEPVGWLWNHTLTTAVYTMYDGNTYDAGPDDGDAAFDKLSRLCMSCHDGTIALDAYGGSVGSIFINGDEKIGTDLADDHPIGRDAVYLEEGSSRWQPADANHKLGPNGELKLREMNVDGTLDYVVGCMTCHTPHYKGYDHQLRMTNNSSALCLSCHIK
ncbi:MAG: cytochrome c3 family protein [Phycisphaerales bacterium]|nr:cytochrome c3 family protein [Phycisphaerales bacterium]